MSAKEELAVFAPSLTVMLTGATPVWPKSGVTVTMRLLSLPPTTMFALGSNVVFEEEAETVRTDAGLSASPIVNGMSSTEELMRQLVVGIVEMTGAVLAGRTLTTNEVLFDLPPVSMTQTVTVDEPGWFPPLTLTVRLELLPPKAMLLRGMTVWSDEPAFRLRAEAGSSASRTLKSSG